MKFKLDENFGVRTKNLFQQAGFDVQTIRQESLQGSSDQTLYKICCAESRCLITLDLDFADVTRFPPEQSGGIAVIRLPRNPSLDLLEKLVTQLIQALTYHSVEMSLEKNLWIVEPGRIRVHQD
jgi:predicted nuclease of predicted toxin-antitoxin system